MGNRLSRRRQVVNDNYTRPQGLDQIRDVDYRKVRKLILESRLAPCYPGDDECDDGPLEECPICFLYYPTLNRSKCCRQGICTVCFLKVKNHDSTMPSSCPFCKTLNFAVEYKGAKSKEDRTREQIEEQKVAEAKIMMRQREVQGEEEKQHKKEVSFPDGKWGEKAKRKGNINLIVEEAFDESLEAERMTTTSDVPHVVPPPISPIWECATCGGPASTRCSRCKSFKYCSGKCQIIHWKQGHREECRRPDDIDSSSTCVALDEASPMGDFGHGHPMQAETQFDVQLNPVNPSATSAEVSPTCSASLELSRPERRVTERRVSRKTTKEKVDVRHSVGTISADGSLRSTPIILNNANAPHKVMEKAKVGHNTIAHGVLPGQYITGDDYVRSSSSSSSSSLLPLPSSSPSPSPLSPSPISGGLAGAFAALARRRELIEESSYSECMSPSNMLPSSSGTLWRSCGQYITGNDYVPSSSSSSSLLPLPSSPSPSPLSPSPISGGLAGAFAALARRRELIEESSYSECMSPSNMLPSSSGTLWRSCGQYITGNDYVPSSSSSLLPLPSSSPSPSPLSPSPISGGLAGAFAALARRRELIEESSYSECMSPSNMLPSSSGTL